MKLPSDSRRTLSQTPKNSGKCFSIRSETIAGFSSSDVFISGVTSEEKRRRLPGKVVLGAAAHCLPGGPSRDPRSCRPWPAPPGCCPPVRPAWRRTYWGEKGAERLVKVADRPRVTPGDGGGLAHDHLAVLEDGKRAKRSLWKRRRK